MGSFEGKALHKSVMRRVEAGYGADRPVTYVAGREFMGFEFGKVIPRTFTICSVTRYTGTVGVGEPRGRILQTRESNFLHGHWSDTIGVAHYDGWATKYDDKIKTSQEWMVLCGTNGAKRVYIGIGEGAVNIATGQGNTLAQDNTLVINDGKYIENSAFAAMEIITWNRALSDAEMEKLACIA